MGPRGLESEKRWPTCHLGSPGRFANRLPHNDKFHPHQTQKPNRHRTRRLRIRYDHDSNQRGVRSGGAMPKTRSATIKLNTDCTLAAAMREPSGEMPKLSKFVSCSRPSTRRRLRDVSCLGTKSCTKIEDEPFVAKTNECDGAAAGHPMKSIDSANLPHSRGGVRDLPHAQRVSNIFQL
jgi:hypothetical protein